MMGDIQRRKADMSLMMSTSDVRLPIIDLPRLYEADPLVIVSLKPLNLPQYLAIARPFTVNVWIYFVMIIFIWGLFLWMLEKLRSKLTGERSRTLNSSIFYSWAVILEDPPPNPPRNSTGQMLVGWWMMAAMLISTGFRSSLVANLTVPGKTKPIDSYEDLLAQNNWHWGIHNLILSGQPKFYFTNTKDPILKQIYENSESIRIEDGLNKVLEGNYAFMASKNRVIAAISLIHTNRFGRTVIYISKNKYKVVTDVGWAFGKGSPFFNLFNGVFNRLVSSGLIEYWTKDVIATKVKQVRREVEESGDAFTTNNKNLNFLFENDEVILRTRHLIGPYIFALGGFAFAFLVFLTEKLINRMKI